MKFAIIISPDLAGENILDKLLKLDFKDSGERFNNKPVYQFENAKIYLALNKCVYNENIDREIDADFFIFATTHSSKSGIPSLTVHPIGNWGSADLGGKPGTLISTDAILMKRALLILDEINTLKDFAVAQEATHHGPYLEKPTIFIEIGSTEKEWTNQEAGRIIAECIVKLTTSNEPKNANPKLQTSNQIIVMGLGGLHIHEQFEKVRRNTNYAFGHICAKYNLENFNE
ncbi:D-aminoacyl-tRNA deacylase, partial [archaeon]|nr:D-aminoacyl-tRNA deacylase [archaeon]